MKRSDVTGNRFEWELGENKVMQDPLPSPYFIVLASSVNAKEVKAIEFHIIDFKHFWNIYIGCPSI